MLHRGKEILLAWGQKLPPQFARRDPVPPVPKEAEAIRHEQIGLNFFDHAKRLLIAVGAFEKEYLPYNEDRVFLVERVAAYFFDELFPIGHALAINRRKNRISTALRDHIRERLPVPLTFPQEATPEQHKCEALLDNTAGTIFGIIYRDLFQKGNVNQLEDYFLSSLADEQMPLSYSPSDLVIVDVRQAISSLQGNLRSLQTS